ncbi:MAG: DUF456 domain-containing protein [Burkholderiales bacterium]|nr:DUF456 domain-containing protein [Burkholderiales bacterium]
MDVSPDLWLWLLAFGLMSMGVAGTVLPALPGPPLVFGGMLVAAWIDGFQRVGYVTLIILGVITLCTVVIDLLAAVAGAKRLGASRRALIGAGLGTVLGLFLGIVGLVFGPFIGALAGELSARRDLVAAGRVAFGAWLGVLLAMVLKLGLVFAMLGIFTLAYFFSSNRFAVV